MEVSSKYGIYDKRFEKVFNKFDENLKSGIDVGASFAVYSNGRPLIDLSGGFKNKEKTDFWSSETTVCIHSTGKGIIAMCFALLIERGQMDLDARVSKYWPEFASNSKENILVRTLLSHQAGLYAWKEKMSEEDFYNWDYCTKLLADQEPLHESGAEICYHAKSIGFLAGELIKRISGMSAGRFLKEELIDPLNLSCTIGTPTSEHKNIAELISSPNLNDAFNDRDKIDNYTMGAFLNPGNRTRTANTEAFRSAEIPALNCHSNSSSLAQLYDNFINSNTHPASFIKEETVNSIIQKEVSGMDKVMKSPMTWSPVGFMVGGGKSFGKSGKAFGHTGWGGSLAFADPENKIGIAYSMNLLAGSMLGDSRAIDLIAATYESI
ncbi:MAG: serine hydrolase domain-containing protein [Candidatus Pelagibacterales bacterium]|jgi:CubicO group peptidase (beta-lactamase class C family)|tara:strand:- start:34203 stop:35342 length:1140 start_codon:yes stop_codon:yes gene_type:complete